MTRTEKLEAALQKAQASTENFVSLIEGEFCGDFADYYTADWKLSEDAKDAINAALEPPPTSEWNEAIEAAAELCDGRAIDCDYEADTSIALEMPDQSGIMRELAERIRALKRKERP